MTAQGPEAQLTIPPGQVDYGPRYGVTRFDPVEQPGPGGYGGRLARAAVDFAERQSRRIPSLPRSICVEADQQSLTVGDLRRLLDRLPDDVEVRADSLPVKVAAHYGSLLLLDTSTQLPNACPGCRQHGCDGRCS